MTETLPRIRIAASESVAQRWLLPRLAAFKAAHPEVAVAVETRHADLDAGPRGHDARIAFVDDQGAAGAPGRDAETLFTESLLAVCSPSLLADRPTPRVPADLAGWPLVYRVRGDADWPYWAARRNAPAPALGGAWGFGLYSMVVAAAVAGMGAAVGHSGLIGGELARGALVPVFEGQADAALRCCLFTSAASRRGAAVSRLREWLLGDAPASGRGRGRRGHG